MRIRLEVEGVLDRMEHGTGQGMSLGQVIPRINVELDRQTNGLGEHYETCKQLRDGLIELAELRKDKRDAKIHELRELVVTLPTYK